MKNFILDERESKGSMKEQVHYIILRILRTLDSICKKHEINYWLDYGTLLGAIRHKGFIPWDHEADIGMLRTDFKKLLNVIKEELPDDLFFQCRESDPFYTSHLLIEGKIRDRFSNYIDYYEKEKCKWHNGIQVDIFVYDIDPEMEECISNSFERYFSEGNINLTFEEISHTIDKEFEGFNFPVPIGFDSYLKKAYGDYLILPPEESQIFPKIDTLIPCNHPEAKAWDHKI
ncbi:LicD family protein [Sphingobacterium sp.]|uniref:LicD family protein n=1 Tax=Sphingobacterium sp. TaxID=341027 RepID=UPI0031D585BC